MASGKKSAWKRRVRELCNYLLCLVLGGIFLFMGLTQPTYTEENTTEIYAEAEESLMSSQGRRLYPVPLLVCTDGTEYTFGFSCYRSFLPISTALLIRFVSVSIPAIIGGLGIRLPKSQRWKRMVPCIFHCVIPIENGKPAG